MTSAGTVAPSRLRSINARSMLPWIALNVLVISRLPAAHGLLVRHNIERPFFTQPPTVIKSLPPSCRNN